MRPESRAGSRLRPPCRSIGSLLSVLVIAVSLHPVRAARAAGQDTAVDVRLVSLEHVQLPSLLYLWTGSQQRAVSEAYRLVLKVSPLYFIRTDADPGPQIFLDEIPVSVVDDDAATSSVLGFVPSLAPAAELWYTLRGDRALLESIDAGAALASFRRSGLVSLRVNVADLLQGGRRLVSVSASSRMVDGQTVYDVVLQVENFTDENFVEAFGDDPTRTGAPDVVVGGLAAASTTFSESAQTISAVFDEPPREGTPVVLRYPLYDIPAAELFPGVP